jgi:hypothetical protein
VVTPTSVVPDASKKTASGATPEVRAGTSDKEMPPACAALNVALIVWFPRTLAKVYVVDVATVL